MNTIGQRIAREPVSVGHHSRLRQFTLKDANALLALHKDPEVTRWLLDDIKLDNLAVVSDFIVGLTKLYNQYPGQGIWAFERYQARYSREQLVAQGASDFMDENKLEEMLQPRWVLQGWFNLTTVPDYPMQIELGSRLARDAWGQRIACGVGQCLVDYAFDVLEQEHLYLHCHPGNQSALYCAAYLGFEHPENAPFLGSDSLKLSCSLTSAQQAKSFTSGVRKRHAVSCARQWSVPQLSEACV